jgi:hypothetical protein
LESSFLHLLGNSLSEPHLSDYTSNALRLFLEGLEQVRESQILDVGSARGDNITFFAQRVKRLYICDMFFHLSRDPREILPPNQVWKHFDYPPHSFHGILLWNLVDHLDDWEVGRIAELCYEMLKPGGMLLASLTGKGAVGTVAYSFVIKDGYRLNISPKPDMDLPLHVRSNREVQELLSLFTPVKSFLYRNGLREYLFRHD